ncbi:MAG TPA: hypothetical protein PKH24_09780 [Sedimentisphaerales bacterium]|jgi:hypothetical protein|nr:hypothetical protein [Sedimentisphaerales bacterium]HNU28786.1 hypothetical protein [Sedimentisphaerales bacterium]
MAKKTPKDNASRTAEDIVKESLPDMEIVDSSSRAKQDAARSPVKPGASMDRLREKYLGSAAPQKGVFGADSGAPDEQDVEVRQVRPKKTPADPVDDPGPRVVIISKKKGILGSQG